MIKFRSQLIQGFYCWLVRTKQKQTYFGQLAWCCAYRKANNTSHSGSKVIHGGGNIMLWDRAAPQMAGAEENLSEATIHMRLRRTTTINIQPEKQSNASSQSMLMCSNGLVNVKSTLHVIWLRRFGARKPIQSLKGPKRIESWPKRPAAGSVPTQTRLISRANHFHCFHSAPRRVGLSHDIQFKYTGVCGRT